MAIAKVQSASDFGSAFASKAKAFGSNVTAGDLLVCAVVTTNSSGETVTVTDTQGNAWSLAAGAGTGYVANGSVVVSIFTATAGSTGACTVTAAAVSGLSQNIGLAIAEYSGADTTPTGAGGTNTGTGTTATTGSVPVITAGSLVVGAVGAAPAGTAPTPTGANGYTLEESAGGSLAVVIYLLDKLGVGSADTPTVSLSSSIDWTGRGVTFGPGGGGGGSGPPPGRVTIARRVEVPTDPMFSE